MVSQLEGGWQRLSLSQQFMLVSFAVLLAGMVGTGGWVGRQIEAGVTNSTAATSALYVASVIAPQLQSLADGGPLSAAQQAALDRLLKGTPLGREVAAFKLWDAEGRILYSTDSAAIGEVYPVEDDLAEAWEGELTAHVSDLQEEENVRERELGRRLLEIYSPVRVQGSDEVIAVAEFYHSIEAMEQEIRAAQRRSWLVVATATLTMYLLLARIVQRASDTIVRQRAALSDNVTQLTELLGQNQALHGRVSRAAARATALNERFLRRLSAELHDGPAQELALALLRLDHLRARSPAGSDGEAERADQEHLTTIERSLQHALQEVRAISAGLRLPELEGLTLDETLTRVVRAHERRTATTVALQLDGLPAQASLPVKITLYRLIQEALSNAFRHASGVAQRVTVTHEAGSLVVEISDGGPGFDGTQRGDWNGHLGLLGMRERVESLGGHFAVESRPGQGTRVKVRLASQAEESSDGD